MEAFRELWHIETLRWQWTMHHPFWAFGPAVVAIVIYVIWGYLE